MPAHVTSRIGVRRSGYREKKRRRMLMQSLDISAHFSPDELLCLLNLGQLPTEHDSASTLARVAIDGQPVDVHSCARLDSDVPNVGATNTNDLSSTVRRAKVRAAAATPSIRVGSASSRRYLPDLHVAQRQRARSHCCESQPLRSPRADNLSVGTEHEERAATPRKLVKRDTTSYVTSPSPGRA